MVYSLARRAFQRAAGSPAASGALEVGGGGFPVSGHGPGHWGAAACERPARRRLTRASSAPPSPTEVSTWPPTARSRSRGPLSRVTLGSVSVDPDVGAHATPAIAGYIILGVQDRADHWGVHRTPLACRGRFKPPGRRNCPQTAQGPRPSGRSLSAQSRARQNARSKSLPPRQRARFRSGTSGVSHLQPAFGATLCDDSCSAITQFFTIQTETAVRHIASGYT